MKNLRLTLIPLLSFFILSSCTEKSGDTSFKGEAFTANVEATSSTTWHYYSFSEEKFVGTGEENETDNAKWGGLTSWDIAIKKYEIKTNSGTSTSVGAKGGDYTFDAKNKFEDVAELPSGITFMVDKLIVESGMGGTEKTTSKSTTEVIRFKLDEDGARLMPPVYLKSPVYIFKTNDGEKYYKVNFTQYEGYKDNKKVTGIVQFYAAEIK